MDKLTVDLVFMSLYLVAAIPLLSGMWLLGKQEKAARKRAEEIDKQRKAETIARVQAAIRLGESLADTLGKMEKAIEAEARKEKVNETN